MTIFELVRVALDELYAQGQKEYGAKLDDVVKDRMVYLSGSYQKLTDEKRKPLTYKDPATRIAYVYSYVTAHADYIVQVLESLGKCLDGNCFASSNLRVSCLGGGPGSDILAVLKFLSENDEPVEKLTCYLLDAEQAWADTWTELDDSISEGVNLKANFQPLDVTNPESWKYQTNFKNADVFILSFFVSEVYNIGGGKPTQFFQELMDCARPGAYFLYIDNGHETFNDYFDAICADAGLELVLGETNVPRTPRFAEQAEALHVYTNRFGRMPKLRSYLSYRVFRKPE